MYYPKPSQTTVAMETFLLYSFSFSTLLLTGRQVNLF